MKKYINMTAFLYTEDLVQQPFKFTDRFHKQFRTCRNDDYGRYGDKSYVDDIESAVGFFPENCIDNWKNLSLLAQNYVYKYGFMRV